MKKRNKIISLACAVCIVSSNIPLTVFANDVSLNEQTIDVKFRQIISLQNISGEDNELMEQAILASSTTGWVYNEPEQCLERFVTYDDIEVFADKEEVILDNNGKARFISQSDKDIDIKVYDPILDKTYVQRIGGDSVESKIIIDMDISPMFSIDTESKTLAKASATDPFWVDGELGYFGKRLHCNRFNGPLGNGRYYSNNASPQAILNFTQSDCDFALASSSKCLADYGSNPFCAATPESKQASCSTLLGHYNRFHQH